MPKLNCEISHSLLNALAAKAQQTGETIDHIVISALAEVLQIEHATLFQISTAGALIEGVTQAAVTVGELARHGDFGLGTFADLNGEMVVVNGVNYQVTREGVVVAPHDAPVPFAVVTHFMPEWSVDFGTIVSLEDLAGHLDALRNTDNEFFAVRIDGIFGRVKTRVFCKSDRAASLVEAASSQAEFEFHDVEGVLAGFWTPEYTKSVNISGWHLHFLTADRRGGGHLLDCQSAQLHVQMQHLSDFHMALPETAAFMKADLRRDTSKALAEAEKDHG